MDKQERREERQKSLSSYLDTVYGLRGGEEMQTPDTTRRVCDNSPSNYSIVISKMKESCKMRLSFLNHSMEVFCDNWTHCDSSQDSLQLKNVAILLLYYHFSSVRLSNAQICRLWEAQTQEAATKPQVRLSQTMMDSIAIRQLIPNSKFINVQHTQQVISELLGWAGVGHKQILEALAHLFENTKGQTNPKVQKNQAIQKKDQKVGEVINFLSSMKVRKERESCNFDQDLSIQNWRLRIKK